MGHDFKISTCICRWKVREKEGEKEERLQSKGSEVKVEGRRFGGSKGVGSGKYMKRKGDGLGNRRGDEMEGEPRRVKGRRGKRMRKSEGPQRAVPVEKSCNVGGLSWENMHGL